MIKYEDFKKEILKDPEVKTAYDGLSPEYDIIQAMIDTRKSQHMTQKDLSEATGITQADIRELKMGQEIQAWQCLKDWLLEWV